MSSWVPYYVMLIALIVGISVVILYLLRIIEESMP